MPRNIWGAITQFPGASKPRVCGSGKDTSFPGHIAKSSKIFKNKIKYVLMHLNKELVGNYCKNTGFWLNF